MTYFLYTIEPAREFVIKFWPLIYVFLVLAIIIEISIICFKTVARSVPTNYILLGLFTFCFGYIAAVYCISVMIIYENGG